MVRLLLLLALIPGSALAQQMRPFTTFRQAHGETRLAARLEYGAGTLVIAPGRSSELYRMKLSYDEDRFVPVSDFDVSSGSVVLGVKAAGEGGVRVVSRQQLAQHAVVTFSPEIDLALDLGLGAVDADLELGGLRVSQLALKTGASQTRVRFSEPNRTRCRRADISAGAAELTLLGLGNSRCDEIEFEGGIGKVTLDFSGAWTSSSRVRATLAMGELTLRLPRRVGIRITMDRFLSSFQPAGLTRRGDAFESPNFAQSSRRLDLELTSAIGDVNIEWTD